MPQENRIIIQYDELIYQSDGITPEVKRTLLKAFEAMVKAKVEYENSLGVKNLSAEILGQKRYEYEKRKLEFYKDMEARKLLMEDKPPLPVAPDLDAFIKIKEPGAADFNKLKEALQSAFPLDKIDLDDAKLPQEIQNIRKIFFLKQAPFKDFQPKEQRDIIEANYKELVMTKKKTLIFKEILKNTIPYPQLRKMIKRAYPKNFWQAESVTRTPEFAQVNEALEEFHRRVTERMGPGKKLEDVLKKIEENEMKYLNEYNQKYEDFKRIKAKETIDREKFKKSKPDRFLIAQANYAKADKDLQDLDEEKDKKLIIGKLSDAIIRLGRGVKTKPGWPKPGEITWADLFREYQVQHEYKPMLPNTLLDILKNKKPPVMIKTLESGLTNKILENLKTFLTHLNNPSQTISLESLKENIRQLEKLGLNLSLEETQLLFKSQSEKPREPGDEDEKYEAAVKLSGPEIEKAYNEVQALLLRRRSSLLSSFRDALPSFTRSRSNSITGPDSGTGPPSPDSRGSISSDKIPLLDSESDKDSESKDVAEEKELPSMDTVQIHENMRNQFSAKLSAVYQAIFNMNGNPPPDSGWVREPKKGADKYGITTWTYTKEKGIDSNIPVGTNGKMVVKLFNQDSYDYVKTEDFIDRGDLLFDAAESTINDFHMDETKKDELSQRLKEMKTQFKAEIESKCSLDLNIMKRKDLDPKLMKEYKAAKVKHFKEKFKIADNILKKLVINLAKVVSLQENPSNDRIKSLAQGLKEKEIEVIAKRGRPNILKIGKLGNHAIFSAQFTQGERTLPSSMRKIKLDDSIKLSNHVLDLSGDVNLVNLGFEVTQMIDTHSTYSPYQEKDKLLRQKIANEAVMEKITATARNIKLGNPKLGSQEQPIPVSLTTLMLFTPLHQPFAQLGQEANELDQMQVSRRALEMARHQKQPIEIMVDDQKVYVNFNLNYMSIPANRWGMNSTRFNENPITNNALEGTINAQGFFEYCQNVESALGKRDQVIQRHLIGPERAALAEVNKELKEKFQEMQGFLQKYNPKITEDPDNKKIMKENYKILKKKIKKLEQKQFAIYQKALQKAKSQFKYQPPADSAQSGSLESRYARIQELFYSGKYKQVEYAFQFHVLYLITNEQMGRMIESFCKSAEDRTGWLCVYILAHQAFKLSYQNRDPDLNDPEDKKNFDRIFAFAAHELSARLDNTKYNSESRGHQVKASVTNPHIGMEMGDMMAKLAKGIFKWVKLRLVLDLMRSAFNKIQLPKASFFRLPSMSNPQKPYIANESKSSEEKTPLMASSAGLYGSRPRSSSVSSNDSEPTLNQSQDGLIVQNEADPKEKVNFVQVLKNSGEKLKDFCRQHKFSVKEEVFSPGVVQSNHVVLQGVKNKELRIEVTKNTVKSTKLPPDPSDKMEAVEAIVALYMVALQGRKSKSHTIKCKNAVLLPTVVALLAEKLREEKIVDAKINTVEIAKIPPPEYKAKQEHKFE